MMAPIEARSRTASAQESWRAMRSSTAISIPVGSTWKEARYGGPCERISLHLSPWKEKCLHLHEVGFAGRTCGSIGSAGKQGHCGGKCVGGSSDATENLGTVR